MPISEFFPVWSKLSPSQQETLSSAAVMRRAAAGTVIHRGSDDCMGLLLITSGRLRAYILSPEGREISIYRLLEGDICLLSASCIMRSIQFDIHIEAERDTEFYLIPPDVYKACMEESAPLSNFTGEVMASRFSEVMWLIEKVLWQSFDKRLAAFLLEEAELEGTDSLRMTHETIGSHMGNPREVVTRMLRWFQSEGMVALSRGSIELKDKKRLRELAG